MAPRSPSHLSPEEQQQLDDELLALVLDGVENANMRRMLEFALRKHGLQRACILKDMFRGAAQGQMAPPQ